MIIRDATYDEAIAITSWGRLMFEESQFSQYDYDDYKMIGLIRTLVEHPRGIAIVAELEEEKQVIGGMFGSVDEHFFGKTLVAQDYAVFLAPEFRRGRTGLKLIQAYVQKAKDIGADEITLGNSTGVEAERVAKLYERMGFVKYGYNFRMNAKT